MAGCLACEAVEGGHINRIEACECLLSFSARLAIHYEARHFGERKKALGNRTEGLRNVRHDCIRVMVTFENVDGALVGIDAKLIS